MLLKHSSGLDCGWKFSWVKSKLEIILRKSQLCCHQWYEVHKPSLSLPHSEICEVLQQYLLGRGEWMATAGTFCTKQIGNPRAMCQNWMYLFFLRHLDQGFSDFSACRNHLEKLLKQTAGLFCKDSDSVSLQWGLRIWIVNCWYWCYQAVDHI